MRNSMRRALGGGVLFLLSVLACSSRDTPEQRPIISEEALTQSVVTRILGFEGTIGSGGDWVPTGGTVASSALHAAEGTHSVVMSGAGYITLLSTPLSALGSVGSSMSLQVWLPTQLAGQQNKGQVQATFNSASLPLNTATTATVSLTSLTPGQFSTVTIPLDSSIYSKLSQSGYTDLTIKLAFTLADTTHQTFIDKLAFATGSGGSGGSTSTGGTSSTGTKATGGTGGTSSGLGGTHASGGVTGTLTSGGTKATGGTTNTGGTSSTGGTKTTGGTTSSGGSKATGGASATGGTSASGGTKTTGGTSATGGTKSTGGTSASGGNTASGGTIASGGTKTGGASATGGTKATGGSVPTGGTVATGGSLGTGGVIIVYTGGTSASGGANSGGNSTASGGTSSAGGNTSATAVSGGASASGGTMATGGLTNSGGTSGIAGGSSYTFSFQLPAGVNRNQVVFATTNGDLWIDDGVSAINGAGYASVSAVGGGKVNRIGVGAQVQNVWSSGDVQLANNATVHGSLYTTGAVVPQAGSQVLGITAQQANIGPLQTISWSVVFPTNTLPAVNLATAQTLTPGGYPDYDIKTGGQLNLSNGTYYFQSLMIEPGGSLQINNAQGPVYIYLQNGFTQRGTVTPTVPNANILFGLAGTSPVSIGTSLNGILVAPAASVSLETLTGSTHVGAVFAQSITAHQNTATRLQALMPSNFCGPNDACGSFCACPAGSYPCNGSSTNCDTGLTCDSTSNTCLCQTNCANKHCGDDPNDGCGGVCPALCANGQTGCTGNLQCPAGSQCFIGGGPRKGFATGTNICLPTICAEQDPKKPSCGVGSADCGTCPACVPNCSGKTCGDDGCGGSCGSLPPPPNPTTTVFCSNGIIAAIDAASIPGMPSPQPVASSAAQVPGTIPGQFEVTPRGTPEYSMAIEVPPGREGVEPKLSIVHTGDMGNGILGQGWALRGLSRIERCRKTIAQDTVAKQISLTSDDALCIDGQRLFKDPGKDGMPSHMYHTEIESFQLVQPLGDGTDGNGNYVGPSGFTVWTKSGLKLTYGGTEVYSHYESSGRPGTMLTSLPNVVVTNGVNRVWNLSKVEDRAGNYMAIAYTRYDGDGGTSEIVPDYISYGGQATSSEISGSSFFDSGNEVNFTYEQRPDPRHHYVLGQWDYSTLRLKTIATLTNGQPVRTYNIGYEDVGYGEERVGSMQVCGNAGDGSVSCMPASTFSYNQPTGGSTVMQAPYADPNVDDTIFAILDADGDGSDDVLVTGNSGKTFSLYTQYAPTGANSPPNYKKVALADNDPIKRYYQSDPLNYWWSLASNRRVIDFNGDGHDDLVLVYHGDLNGSGVVAGTLVFLSFNGTGFSATTYPTACTVGGYVGDFDGDGRKDYLCFDDGNENAYIRRIIPNPNGGWEVDVNEIELPGINPGYDSGTFVFDVDGDGVDDLVYAAGGQDSQVLVNTNGGPITAMNADVSWQSAGFTTVTTAPSTLQCSQTGAASCTFPDSNTQNFQIGYALDNYTSNMAIVDVNGDGLKDVYYVGRRNGVTQYPNCNGTCTGVTSPILYLNTGKGFVPSSVSIPSTVVFSSVFPVVYDYDHDGREDLVDPIYGFMLRSTLRGTLEYTQLPDSDNYLKQGLVYGNTTVGAIVVADLNGDGTADWLISNLNPGGIRWGNRTNNGQLNQINDGLGKGIVIGYDGDATGILQNYTPPKTYSISDPGNLPNDVTRLRRVAPLVSMYSEYQSFHDSAGNVGGKAYNGHHVYTYTGANMGLNGRGWYGFQSMTEQVLNNPGGNVFRTNDVYYDNTQFWNAGKVGYTRETYANLAQTPWHAAQPRVIDTTYTWTQHSTNIGNEQFTGLDKKLVMAGDGGTIVVLSATTYQYNDGVGNVTLLQTSTQVPTQSSWSTDTTQTNTTYVIDLGNWLVASPQKVTESDSFGPMYEYHNTYYSYYPNGLLNTLVREPGDPTLQRTTTLTRDPTSSVVTKIDTVDNSSGDTRTVQIDYDSQQRFPTAYHRKKPEDSLNPELVTGVQYDPRTGQILTSVDPNGVVNQWQYDAFGRVRNAIGPTETAATTYLFGVDHSSTPGAMTVATVVTGTGEWRLYESNLDSLGQVQWTIQPGVNGVNLGQEFGRDWAERVVSASVRHRTGDMSQGSYAYTYDAFGRLASITAPDQRTTHIDYMSNTTCPTSQQELFNTSDFATEATVRTEPNGLQEISVMNYRGQPVRVIQSNASDNVTAAQALSGSAGTMSQYLYGFFGRFYQATDSRGEITMLGYDSIGRRTSINSPSTGTDSFTFNNFDEVSSETDADGNTRCYAYDSLGRLVELTQGNADGTCTTMGSVIASWTYDGGGDNELDKLVKSFRAVSPGDTSGTTVRYSYEPKSGGSAPNVGRLQVVVQDVPNMANPLVMGLEYNGPWVSTLTYPNANPDATGSNAFALTYTRDSIGTITSVSGSGVSYWQLTGVDQGQRIAQETFGSGTVTSYDYYTPGMGQCNFPNSASCMPGALHSRTTMLPGDTSGATVDLQYTYDNGGYLSVITDVQKNTTEQYSYDVYGRATSKANVSLAGLDKLTEWHYTPDGDITSVSTGDMHAQTGVVQTYSYDSVRHHLLSNITDTLGNTLSLGYAGNKGNTTSRSGMGVPNGNQTIQYNDFDMPIRITGGLNGDTTLEYDAQQHRVAKRGPTDTTLYVQDLYDCTGPSGQASFACNEQHFKIYAGGRQIAQVTRDQFNNDTTNYIHSDHLGSATLVTDATGNVLETRSYDPFGAPSADLTTNAIKTGFTGQEHDADLGLINMKGRIYDPTSRRFLTPDPFVTDPFNPQGLNRYSYVQNNPMNLVDPSGFDEEDAGDDSEESDSSSTTFFNTPGASNQFGTFEAHGINLKSMGSGSNNNTGFYTNTQANPNQSFATGVDASPISEGSIDQGYNAPKGAVGVPGGDMQAPANQNPGATPSPINALGYVADSTRNGTPSPAPATMPTLGNFGPWQGLSALNSYSRTAQDIRNTPMIGVGAGLVAGGAGLVGLGGLGAAPAAVGAAAPEGVALVGGALKFVGGAVSGMTSAAMQGKGIGGIAQQGTINGVVSLANPAGFVTGNAIASGAINSGLSNAVNQLLSTGSVNPWSAAASGGARGLFGYMTIQSIVGATLSDAAAQGMISGGFSAGAGILVNAASGL